MKAINAAKAPAAVGPYVHAIQAGNTIYASGISPNCPDA